MQPQYKSAIHFVQLHKSAGIYTQYILPSHLAEERLINYSIFEILNSPSV